MIRPPTREREGWRAVGVFAASHPGVDPRHVDAAVGLGRAVAGAGLGLVYGGGRGGLMGALADAALGAGGRVVGVVLDGHGPKEQAHPGITELRLAPSLSARKALMAELADAFVALPGGFGTLDELFEMLAWTQLGVHAKPVGVLNVAGYYEPLLRLVDRALADGFLDADCRDWLTVAEAPVALLERMARGRSLRAG